MEPTKEIVYTYFAGHATSVQKKIIGEWLNRPDAREQFFQWLDEWERSHPQYTPDSVAVLERLRQRFDDPAPATSPFRQLYRAEPSFRTGWRWQWAAAVVIPVLVAAGLYLTQDWWNYRTITTNAQQLRTVTLPDGSTVALNSQSTLRVPRWGYGLLSRRVQFRGEAVFSVRHLPDHQPFVVQTPEGVNVEVLGTEFSVSNRRTSTEVVLKKGKVKLAYRSAQQVQENLIMKPGDWVQLDQKGTLKLRQQTDSLKFAGWRYRHFVFNSTPLPEVFRQMREVFGVTVHCNDPELARRTLTGTIRAGSSDELAEALAELLDLRVTHANQTLVFSPNTDKITNQ
ncbi:anti-FecI sigma factor, FecR [Fibrisoma limi BUZ 3]|uniref:Anti-FecI sigma factor, FecR n=1 Tax=Fibrisoma limi BUZ 3 TaxID=1185876 RepID=I2GDT5_9BACT|nr:FecR domain-containing protein [Fibrisoma limi]CCH52059.1 anti-FecI sigma factor, FecR [Fibrisoma limi BUZ 3]